MLTPTDLEKIRAIVREEFESRETREAAGAFARWWGKRARAVRLPDVETFAAAGVRSGGSSSPSE